MAVGSLIAQLKVEYFLFTQILEVISRVEGKCAILVIDEGSSKRLRE